MYPILFQYNDIILPTWHVIFALSVILSFIVFDKLTIKYLSFISAKYKYLLFVCVYIGGYIGARIISIIFEEQFVTDILSFIIHIFTIGPMTLYGGIIGGIGSGILFVIITKGPITSISDFAFLSLLLGISIGRIGCFLNGCDYGIIISEHIDSAPWWAVKFPNLEHYRIPIQLIESASAFILFLIGLFLLKKYYYKLAKGALAIFCINSYAITRFVLENFRGDNDRGWIIQNILSISQFISIIIIFISIIIILIYFTNYKIRQTLSKTNE